MELILQGRQRFFQSRGGALVACGITVGACASATQGTHSRPQRVQQNEVLDAQYAHVTRQQMPQASANKTDSSQKLHEGLSGTCKPGKGSADPGEGQRQWEGRRGALLGAETKPGAQE